MFFFYKCYFRQINLLVMQWLQTSLQGCKAEYSRCWWVNSMSANDIISSNGIVCVRQRGQCLYWAGFQMPMPFQCRDMMKKMQLSACLCNNPGYHKRYWPSKEAHMVIWSSVIFNYVLYDVVWIHYFAFHESPPPPGQNGHQSTDNIFKRIFLNENIWVSIKLYGNMFLGV